MEERLPREEVLRRLSLEHERLMNTFSRLTPEQWIAPRTVGTWTAKDLLACIKNLPDSAFEAGSAIEQALDETIHGALANNTYEHWPIHEAQIREWLARQS